jgi:hypothetical protein
MQEDTTHAAASPETLSSGNCFRCDYDLTSLAPDQRCPECALPVEASLGHLLMRSVDPWYLAKLHKGVFTVQAAIIAMILVGFVNVGITVAMGNNMPISVEIAMSIVNTGLSFVMLYGWWLFSEPHPDYEGTHDGSDARRVVRILLIVSAIVSVISTVLYLFMSQKPSSVLVGAMVLLGVVSLLITIAYYIFQMLYIRWMATLLSNRKVYDRAKRLLWLGPLLMTVGLLLIGLGPIIALVLYWNMLDWIRKDLKAIRAEPAPA